MLDDSVSEPESDCSMNTIINNINVNTYNNINNIQVNNINEINYIIDINNINTITNYNNTNNYRTVNSINPPSNNNASSSPPSPRKKDSPRKTKDELNVAFSENEKRTRLFSRTTTQHKRRGSDTESSPKLDEKYQRRHSEGKVLRIAGLREQVSFQS